MTVLRLFGIVVVLIGMAVAVKGGMLPFGSGSGSTARRCSSRSTRDLRRRRGVARRLPRRHGDLRGRARNAPASRSSARATASYCLQAQAGTTIEHEVGPGGVVTTGAC